MAAEESPLVGIIMGSDSDLPYMCDSAKALDHFEVPHEVRFISAHRTPGRMIEYGRTAVERGLQIVIAGAGGSAHLQGMSASETRLPVLGVAIEGTIDPLQCAVGSQVKMPRGIPLSYIGKNNDGAWNAGLEAVRILALTDDGLAARYQRYTDKLEQEVIAKDARVVEIGWEAYLQEMQEASMRKQIEQELAKTALRARVMEQMRGEAKTTAFRDISQQMREEGPQTT